MSATARSDDARPNLKVHPDGTVNGDGPSLFIVGTTLLRHRGRIARWALAGGVLAGLLVLTKPTLYTTTASFIPQGSDGGRSGLAGLAGQFGISLPSSSDALSPDFYVRLITSRELLDGIVRDTVPVAEQANRRVPYLTLLGAKGSASNRREEDGVRRLSKMIRASASKTTGLVDFSVSSQWPSVSAAIAAAVIAGINDFNQRLRQEQAGAERKFVEGRLAIAGTELRAAEDRLEAFLRNNRQFANSPDLSFQHDRLQRDISLKQQVFTSLTQSYEEVRMREVRDIPVITLVEAPVVPAAPDPSGRVLSVLLGILLGAFAGVVLATISESVSRRREAGDRYADEISGTLGAMRGTMLRPVQRFKERMLS